MLSRSPHAHVVFSALYKLAASLPISRFAPAHPRYCPDSAVMVLVALLFHAALAFAAPIKRATAFFNPADGGGSMLDVAGTGVGEPLNVRISGSHASDLI